MVKTIIHVFEKYDFAVLTPSISCLLDMLK